MRSERLWKNPHIRLCPVSFAIKIAKACTPLKIDMEELRNKASQEVNLFSSNTVGKVRRLRPSLDMSYKGWMQVKAIVTAVTIVFIAVGYVLQNWIMGMIPTDGVSSELAAWGVFAALAVVGALLPFLLYILLIMYLIRRQER